MLYGFTSTCIYSQKPTWNIYGGDEMEDLLEQEGRNWTDYLITRITNLIEIGEWEEALTRADQSLVISPENPFLLYLKSVILQNLNRPVEVLAVLEQVRKIHPFEREVIEAYGRNLMFQGYYRTALSVLFHFSMMSDALAGINKVFIHYCKACIGETTPVIEFCDGCIDEFEDDSDATRFLATIRALKVFALIQSQNIDEAITLASEIGEEFHDQLFVAYAKGIAAWKGNNGTEAAELLRLACKANPLDMRARSALADILSDLGHHDEAREIRPTITGFFGSYDGPDNPRYRALELISSGEYEQADRFLSWALNQYPNQSDLILLRISTLYYTGQYEQVISQAESLTMDPTAWKAIYLKASAGYTAGNALDAIRSLIAAIARDRMSPLRIIYHMIKEGFFQNPKTESSEAMALQVLWSDGYSPAIPLFEALADAHPDILEYRVLLTYCYVMAERMADAVVVSEQFFQSDDPDYCMVRALALRAAGCLNDAERISQRIHEQYPDYIPALNMYTRTLLDQDKYRSAYYELLSHKSILTQDATLLDVLTRCLIRAGDFHDAAETAMRIMRNNPDRILDYFLLAKACMFDEQYDTALWAVRESIRLSGYNSETLLLYSKLLLQSACPREASMIFSGGEDFFPNTPEIRYLKTAVRILSGEDTKSESIPEYAARVFQTDKGLLRGYIGDYRVAARLLAEEIRQNPADRSLRVDFAKILFELMQYGEGVRQLSLVIGNGYEDKEIHQLLKKGLNALYLNGSIDELVRISSGDMIRCAHLVHEQAVRFSQYGIKKQAIEKCRYLIQMESDIPEIVHIKADAYHMLGDLEDSQDRYEQSVHIYDELLAIDPDNARYLAEKGLVLDNLGRYHEAEQVLIRALERDPDCGIANSALCWCLSNSGRYKEALSYGNRATFLMPEEWGAWNNRGLAKLGLKDFYGAVSDFKQAIRCHPGEVIARRNLCDALLRMEDTDACGAYDEIVVRFGRSAFPLEEEDSSMDQPVRGRVPGTVAGYMDGYW